MIDLATFRMRIGLYYARSSRLPKRKSLNAEAFTFYLFFISFRGICVPLYIFFRIICELEVFSLQEHFHAIKSDVVRQKDDECAPPPFCEKENLAVEKLIFIILILTLLILLSGDVELNPGPLSSTESSSISESIGDSVDLFLNTNNFVTFTCLNTQSLVSKRDLLLAEFSDRDVLLFTETWFNAETPESDTVLENYKLPYRCDRVGRIGGGVAIYIKNEIYSEELTNLGNNIVESIWVKIHVKGVDILFGLFYRPPDSEHDIWDHINNSIDNAKNTNIDRIIVCGDFNEDQLNPRKYNIKDICLQNSFFQIISDPTYYYESSASLLDLILISDPDLIMFSEVGENVLPNTVRYHCPISGIVNVEKSKNIALKRRVWQYHRGNYELFRNELDNIDWDDLIDNTDLNTAVKSVTDKILMAAETSIPNKIVYVRKYDPPWINGEIRKLIRKRRRLHKKAKNTNNEHDWSKFRKTRNRCVNLVKVAKANYTEKQTALLDSPTHSVQNWWKLLKNLSGIPVNKSLYPPLKIEGNIIENDTDKANCFNIFFCRQSTVDDSNTIVPPFVEENDDRPKLTDVEISEQDIEDVLMQINISKASGPDLIHPRLLKSAASSLKYPLYKLFNKSLQTSKYPDLWKIANVTPVFKNKSEKDCLTNYRPISLLSNIGKVMEKCIFKYIYNFLIRFLLITKFQSGFRPKDSTINQLISIINDFAKAIDAGKEIRVIFCDISKAFDRVWHKGLLVKLKQIGIDGSLLKWLENYLYNRCQRVVINGQQSGIKFLKAGVPQGSILGPILFLIYINDIVNEISCNIRLFADDTSLYLVVDNNEYDAAEMLNNDIETINQWSKKWLVKFNPEKTEVMTISKKIYKPHHPPVYMDNNIIKEVETHKHLGVTFAEDGSWNDHVNDITNKVSSRLSMLRKLKFKLKRKHLQIIYFSFIRPVI